MVRRQESAAMDIEITDIIADMAVMVPAVIIEKRQKIVYKKNKIC